MLYYSRKLSFSLKKGGWMTRTKIVATLGPASSSEGAILELLNAGVDVFRLNMSHGDHTSHGLLIKKVRDAYNKNGLDPVALLGDLCGPKIRVGRIEGGQVALDEGRRLP
jgi:pyruvate kinase